MAAALVLAALGTTGAAATDPPPGPPRPFADHGERRPVAGSIVRAAPAPAAGSTAPCADRAYAARPERWTRSFRWSFHAPSTPRGLSVAAVEKALKRGVRNITAERNDCGRADGVGATHVYTGPTTVRPGIDATGGCTTYDGRNVIGFGRLPGNVTAFTCWWVQGRTIVEADIRLNSAEPWTTSLEGCVNQLMLEAVVTHEAGHAFGLGHVREQKHPHLTMSTYLDGPCENAESTLGLGDMLGLEAKY
jgi:hypothetical protein